MEYAKKIVLGISVYLIAKGVLNLVLGSFAFGNIVSLAVDAAQNTISELTGKIGKLDGISVKTAYSNKIYND